MFGQLLVRLLSGNQRGGLISEYQSPGDPFTLGKQTLSTECPYIIGYTGAFTLTGLCVFFPLNSVCSYRLNRHEPSHSFFIGAARSVQLNAMLIPLTDMYESYDARLHTAVNHRRFAGGFRLSLHLPGLLV